MKLDAGSDRQPALTGGIKARGTIAPGEGQYTEAGAEALLGVMTIHHHGLAEGHDRRAKLCRLRQNPRRCPFRMAAVGGGHMIGQGHMAAPPQSEDGGTAGMAGNPLPLMEYLDDGSANPDVDFLPDQAEGHGISRTVHFNLGYRGGARPFPARKFAGCLRQRLQMWPVQRGKEISAAGTIATHHAHVRLIQQPSDRDVQIGEGKEPVVPQSCIVPQARLRHDDPALRNLHRHFDLGVRHRARTDGVSMAHSRGLRGRAGRMAVP